MPGPLKRAVAATRAASTTDRIDRLAFVFYGPAAARVCELRPGQTLVVGRDHDVEVCIDAHGVSRRHARFSWLADGPVVEDLGSTNGTRLNGRSVMRSEVAPGDSLTLGDLAVGVLARAADEGLPTTFDGYERFVGRLEDEVVRSQAFSRPFGLIRVTPRSENASLTAIAAAARECLRPVDSLGWYGSRELLALLPEADEAAVSAVAKKLVARTDVALLASYASYPADGTDAQTLLAALAEGARTRRRGETMGHASASSEGSSGALLTSDAIKRVFALASKVAPTPLPVLILGETGTGKDVLARTIHEQSPRRSKPFVGINCGAIPATLLESTLFGHERGAFTGADKRTKGVFEQADGGTVFLDEVGELSASAQTALLRVLETRRFSRVGGEQDIEVDVRVLAATHRDLEASGKAGSFREDLRFRLEGISLRLPALRDRPDDVLPLARHFLGHLVRSYKHSLKGFTPAAQEALVAYAWPGNVRELRNAIERCVVVASGSMIDVGDLPERVLERRAAMAKGEVTLPVTVGDDERFQDVVARQQRQLERALLIKALEAEKGNQTRAAKRLHLPLRTLVHKMKVLGIRKQFSAE